MSGRQHNDEKHALRTFHCHELNKQLKEEIAQELGAKLPLKNPVTEIYPDNDKMSRRCAELVKACLDIKPKSLLCFPAGNTIIHTCELLKEMQIKGEIDFSEAEFVALDEWLDLDDEKENCTSFLHRYLYDVLGIKAECKRIDTIIFQHGGIDLMLLGLGMNGHLGLNEPGEHFDSYAKVVNLAETTMEVGQKYFSSPMKLSRGITLGVRHIFETKQVILQVSGQAKQDIVAKMYEYQPTCELPGTVMKLLENGLVILDEDAAAKLVC